MRLSMKLAAALVAASAAPAFADQLVATFSGVVHDIGQGGEVYDGKSFTATFAYDTALGNRTTYDHFDGIAGGTSQYYFTPGTTIPITSATLNIEGAVFDLTATWYTSVTLQGQGNSNTGTGTISFYSYPSESRPDGSFFDDEIGIAGLSENLPDSLDTPITTAVTPYGSSFFKLHRIDPYGAQTSFRVSLDPNALSVTPAPEPGEWAMMIAGLGVVGLVARRRRR